MCFHEPNLRQTKQLKNNAGRRLVAQSESETPYMCENLNTEESLQLFQKVIKLNYFTEFEIVWLIDYAVSK